MGSDGAPHLSGPATGPDRVAAQLRAAGCVAAEEEAAELLEAAGGDDERLRTMVARRVTGEPLAWITGSVTFGGVRVLVHRGVYVPRPQTAPLAERAAALLPADGLAVDLCTGAGAVAAVLSCRRPRARVLASERDPVAVACARANGVEVFPGDLADPIPPWCAGQVDVVTAVVPYVPTAALAFLPRDVLAHEPRQALDGGTDGLAVLRRAVAGAARLLRTGGSLLVELGGDQADQLASLLSGLGYDDVERYHDEDGDLRALTCRWRPVAAAGDSTSGGGGGAGASRT